MKHLSLFSFLADTLSVAGERLTKLCLESIQFDVDPVLVGSQCPNLAQLSVINARVSLGRQTAGAGVLFPRLSQLYLYLVQYLPAIDMHTRSVTTGQCRDHEMLSDQEIYVTKYIMCRSAPPAVPGPRADQCPVPGHQPAH